VDTLVVAARFATTGLMTEALVHKDINPDKATLRKFWGATIAPHPRLTDLWRGIFYLLRLLTALLNQSNFLNRGKERNKYKRRGEV